MDGVKPKTSYQYRKGQWISFQDWPKQSSNKKLYLSDKSELAEEKLV